MCPSHRVLFATPNQKCKICRLSSRDYLVAAQLNDTPWVHSHLRRFIIFFKGIFLRAAWRAAGCYMFACFGKELARQRGRWSWPCSRYQLAKALSGTKGHVFCPTKTPRRLFVGTSAAERDERSATMKRMRSLLWSWGWVGGEGAGGGGHRQGEEVGVGCLSLDIGWPPGVHDSGSAVGGWVKKMGVKRQELWGSRGWVML